MKTADSQIKVGQTLRRVFCAVPFGALSSLIVLPISFMWMVPAFLIGFGTAFGAFTLGHGAQSDLGKTPEDQESGDWIDKIVGKEGFWSEFAGMTLTGLGVALGTAIVLALTGHYTTAMVFLVVPGLLKGLAYWLAQVTEFKSESLKAAGPDELGRNPDGGEVFWGMFMDLGILIALILTFIAGM